MNRKIFNETDEHDARKLYLNACVDWLKEVDRCFNLQSEDSRLPSNDQTLVVREPEGHIIQIGEPQVAEGSYGEILGEEQQGLVRSKKVNHRYPEKISNTAIEAEERPTRKGLKNANKTGREGQIGKRQEIPLTKREKFRRTAFAAIYGGARGAVAGTLLLPGIGTAVGAAGFAITDATLMYAADALVEKQGQEAIRILGTGEQMIGPYESVKKPPEESSSRLQQVWNMLKPKPILGRPGTRPRDWSMEGNNEITTTPSSNPAERDSGEPGLLPGPFAWVETTTSWYNGQGPSNLAERIITFEHDSQENKSPVVSSHYSDSSVDTERGEPSLSDIPQTTQLQQDSGLVENNGHDEISLEASQVPDSGQISQFLDHTTPSSQINDSIGLHKNFDANNDFRYENPIYDSLSVDIPHIEFIEDIEASKEAPQSFASSQDLSTRETIHNDIEMDSRQDIAKREEGPRPEDSSSDQQSRREDEMQITLYSGSIQEFVRKIGENPQEERPQPSTTSEQPSMQSLLPIDRFLSPNDELPDPILEYPIIIKDPSLRQSLEDFQDASSASVENSKNQQGNMNEVLQTQKPSILPANQPNWDHVLASSDDYYLNKPNIDVTSCGVLDPSAFKYESQHQVDGQRNGANGIIASELPCTIPTKRKGGPLVAWLRRVAISGDSPESWEPRKERQHKLRKDISNGLKSARRYLINNLGKCYR